MFISSTPISSGIPTCHNDVIDAGQNNRLFSSGTDIDRERLRLSHMQKSMYYVQICDNPQYCQYQQND
jgi:hypothetical protein